MYWCFPIADSGAFRTLTFVPLCRLRFWCFWTIYKWAQKHFLEYFFHEYPIIKISKFCTQTGSVRNGQKFLVADWTCSVWYGLVGHVKKDACFGLNLTLCTIFKICSKFSEKNRKTSVSSEISTFWVFFSLVHQAVHMHTMNWLKTWLKNCVPEKNAFFTFFVPKTKHYQNKHIKTWIN